MKGHRIPLHLDVLDADLSDAMLFVDALDRWRFRVHGAGRRYRGLFG